MLGNINTFVNSLGKQSDIVIPLAIRLFLAMVFWEAGMQKFQGGIEGFAGFVGSLGFPAPLFFAYCAALTEVVGAVFLAVGLAVRWVVVPLAFTMVVALLGVHFDNGYLAIASRFDPEIMCRLARVNEMIDLYAADKEWLLAKGPIAILQNGYQFALIYLLMVLTLFTTGAGRVFSLDYWLGIDKSGK